MIFGPMTLVLVIGVVFLLVLGFYMIARAMATNARKAGTVACRQCRQANPDHATFCAHCGAKIK